MGFFTAAWDTLKRIGVGMYHTVKGAIEGGITGAGIGEVAGPEGAIAGGLIGGLVGMGKGLSTVFEHGEAHPSQPVSPQGPSVSDLMKHVTTGPGSSPHNFYPGTGTLAASVAGQRGNMFVEAVRSGAAKQSLQAALRAAGVTTVDPTPEMARGAMRGLVNRSDIARNLPFTSPALRALISEAGSAGAPDAMRGAANGVRVAQQAVAAAQALLAQRRSSAAAAPAAAAAPVPSSAVDGAAPGPTPSGGYTAYAASQ